jgi:hypothetical protein
MRQDPRREFRTFANRRNSAVTVLMRHLLRLCCNACYLNIFLQEQIKFIRCYETRTVLDNAILKLYVRFQLMILWHADALPGNNREVSNYERNGVFCAVRAEMLEAG